MSLVKLPHDKGTINPHSVESATFEMIDQNLVVRITWVEIEKEPLLIPVESIEQGKDIINFLIESTRFPTPRLARMKH